MLPIKVKIILSIIFLAIAAPLFAAQTVTGGDDILASFVSLPAMAALVLLVTEFLKKTFSFDKPVTQYVSWGLSLILALIGWYFQYGIFIGEQWYSILYYGAGAGLIANGLFDVTVVQQILILFGLRSKNKKK